VHLGVTPGVLEAGLESKNDRFQSAPCNGGEALGFRETSSYILYN